MKRLLRLQDEKIKKLPPKLQKFARSIEKRKAEAEWNCNNAPELNEIEFDDSSDYA